MSEDKRYRGEIISIASDNLEAWAKRICIEEKIDKPSYCENYLDTLLNERCEDFMVMDGTLWKINAKEVDHYESWVEEADDGEIDFDVTFYSGGCCLQEAIESVVKEMKKNS